MSVLDRFRRNPHLVALLQIDDSPHSIALGAAVGLFLAMTPTVGVQMYLALAVCLWLRCNRLWAIAMVWISNPLTIIPLYYGSYMLGCLLMGQAVTYRFVKFREDLNAVFSQEGLLDMLVEFWNRLVAMGLEVTIPMFLGGTVVGIVCAIPTYFIVYRLIEKRRARKAAKISKEASKDSLQGTQSSETHS